MSQRGVPDQHPVRAQASDQPRPRRRTPRRRSPRRQRAWQRRDGRRQESPYVDGQVAFRRPTAASGSVVFTRASEHNGEVTSATVVRIRFATGQPPQILDVRTTPALREREGCRLSAAGLVRHPSAIMPPVPSRAYGRMRPAHRRNCSHPGGDLLVMTAAQRGGRTRMVGDRSMARWDCRRWRHGSKGHQIGTGR